MLHSRTSKIFHFDALGQQHKSEKTLTLDEVASRYDTLNKWWMAYYQRIAETIVREIGLRIESDHK